MDPPGASGDAHAVQFADITGLADEHDVLEQVESDATPSNRGVKRLRLQYKETKSSGSSTGRPASTLWAFFDESATKQNSAHHTAFCRGCRFAGKQKGVTGKSESTQGHLQKCENVSDKIRAWANDWSKDSEPFADDTADSPEASAPRQSGMQRFLPLKDTPMTSKDQERFEMALLKGTVSANLPFTWIDNEYIQEAFAIARPEISLPQRGQPEKTQVVAGAAASSSQTRQQSESQLMDLDASTSASEFHMAVNAWMADIDAEQRQACIIPAHQDTAATTKDTLSNIFASALLPLLDDDSVSSC